MSSNKNIKLDAQLIEFKILADQGNYDAAQNKISRIIKINKNSFSAYNYRGIFLLKIGKPLEALCDFKKVISLNPDFALAYNYVALCYISIGNFESAIFFLNKAIKLEPNLLETRINLGSCYRDLGKFREALSQFESALAFCQEKEIAHQLIADTLITLLKFDKAKQHHLKAIEINPSNFMNYFLLGSDYLWAGDKINASKNFRMTIELNPNYTQSYYGLSRTEIISVSDPLAINAKNLLKSEHLSKSEHIYLNFFMAKIYENISDSDLFFKYLSQGNLLKKSITNFNIEESRIIYEKSQGIYKNSIFNLSKSPDYISSSTGKKKLIFIVGMPRSGTSLLEQIISNHPLIFGAGEVNTLHKLFINLFSQKFN